MEEILGLGISMNENDRDSLHSKNAKLFCTGGRLLQEEAFIRALSSNEASLQQSAANAYACLLTECSGNVEFLIQWIVEKLTSGNQFHIALPALINLSRNLSMRQSFVNNRGLHHVISVLQKVGVNGNAQQLYELTFVCWTLSLGPDIDLATYMSLGSVQTFVDLMSSAPSRKVVRMAVATLKNLAETQNDDVLTDMLSSGLQRILETMIQSNSFKSSGDPEFEADVTLLNTILGNNYRDLSTFDRWASQVTTGALR
jgi:hypothetical protein